ncbi:hypothetical protein RFI_25994, partial [Reticulomyxa filosa]
MEEKAVLLALQRALFTLCCQAENPLPRFKQLLFELKQHNDNTLISKTVDSPESEVKQEMEMKMEVKTRDPIDFVLSAVTQAIRLRDLERLGEPLLEYEENIEQLNENLLAYAREEGLSETELAAKWMEKLDHRLNNAATFYRDNRMYRYSRECDSKVRGYSRAISVSGACALVILFSKQSDLPSSQYSTHSVAIYSDETCQSLVKIYSAGQAPKDVLLPAVVPSHECWVKLSYPEICPLVELQVLPIHPDLGLSFWLIRFLLQSIATKTLADTTDISMSQSIDMCVQMIQLLFQRWQLTTLQVSPLKQALLSLVFQILSTIDIIAKKRNDSEEIQMAIDNGLNVLKDFTSEAKDIFELESGSEVTTYFQLLVDILVLADKLRSSSCKQITKVSFSLKGDDDDDDKDAEAAGDNGDEEDEASKEWDCPICTLKNPFVEDKCGLCGASRPPIKAKAKHDTKGLSANKVQQQLIGFSTAIQFFKSVDKSNALVIETLFKAAWN